MREIKKDIEQLEEVAHQLDKQTPTGARLAFKKVKQIFAFDEMYKLPGKLPKYSPEKRKKVKDHFKEKINFLVSETKDISHDEGDFLKVGHELRNEAYHNGVLRDSIILSVTSVHYEIVCRLLPRLWIMSYSYSREDEVSAFLNKYGIQGSMIDTESLEKICINLLGDRNSTTDNLRETISDDLINRIDELVETLESYQPDVRPDLTPDELLKEMQFSQTFPGDLKFPETHEGFLEFHTTRDEYRSKFKPKVTLATIVRWKRQATKIRTEDRPGAVMRKLSEINRHLLKIEDIIYEAVAEFDIYIDAQMHS